MTPGQPALGLTDVGGGDGQLKFVLNYQPESFHPNTDGYQQEADEMRSRD